MVLPTVVTLPLSEVHIDATYHTTINAEAFEDLCAALDERARRAGGAITPRALPAHFLQLTGMDMSEPQMS